MLTKQEAYEHFQVEATLHRAYGWEVTVRDNEIIARSPRTGRIRVIFLRRSTATDDTVNLDASA
ncbi:hypothetical protein KGP36_07275 [Patescibacteria group bacterium]|nr:hypothetical protein [Patescibacteria group bacterium]